MNGNGHLPLFSVVMPVYNREVLVQKAIESVLDQTDSDWELIVVDDASSDGTPEVLASYAAVDPRVRVLTNEENLFVPRSLNRGIQAARGRWIVRLDADDFFYRDYLKKLRSVITDLPDDNQFVSCWVTVVDETGQKILDIRLPEAQAIRRMMPLENFLYHPATSFSKSVWERVGGYPEREKYVSEDTEMWKLFLKSGVSLVMVPEHLVCYRIHSTNLTSIKDARINRKTNPLKKIQQGYEWRISLYLKQGMLAEARNEIRKLAQVKGALSIKELYYYGMTFFPRSAVHVFMWELRPRIRGTLRWFVNSAMPFRNLTV